MSDDDSDEGRRYPKRRFDAEKDHDEEEFYKSEPSKEQHTSLDS